MFAPHTRSDGVSAGLRRIALGIDPGQGQTSYLGVGRLRARPGWCL